MNIGTYLLSIIKPSIWQLLLAEESLEMTERQSSFQHILICCLELMVSHYKLINMIF